MRWRHSSSASVAGAFGTLALSGVLILGLVSGCTPSGGATPPPRTPDQTSAAPKSPSPSPTPDPEEVAIAGAKAGYVAYWKALDAVNAKGGADKATKAMLDTMTGKELSIQTKFAKESRTQGLSREGRSVIKEMTVSLVNVGHEPPLVTLRTCVDLSMAKAYRRGKPIKGAPKAFTETPEMHLEGGLWKVQYASNVEVKTCP